ncbi:MAG: type II secretion system F family protein [Nanoarchaeota archaeon]|nr:type II secretion system F family protein [Nanoarchaeota archaeon]
MADDDFGLFSYKLFRPIAKRYAKPLFRDLHKDLQKSGMRITLEEYFSEFLLVELLVVPLFFVTSFFLLSTIMEDLLTALLTTVLFSLFIAVGVLTFFFLNPANAVQEREKKIDNALHFAALYMATLATTGTPPFMIFKVMSGFKEFGEISIIALRISEEVELFGYDLPESLARQAEIVPSRNLSELLWGIRATIISGGDLNSFLNEKSKTFTTLFRRRLEEYVQTMSLFMEMYITVVIVGTIFVIVLSTIMSMMGGLFEQVQLIQTLFIGLGVPFVTTAFIIMLKTISPTEV